MWLAKQYRPHSDGPACDPWIDAVDSWLKPQQNTLSDTMTISGCFTSSTETRPKCVLNFTSQFLADVLHKYTTLGLHVHRDYWSVIYTVGHYKARDKALQLRDEAKTQVYDTVRQQHTKQLWKCDFKDNPSPSHLVSHSTELNMSPTQTAHCSVWTLVLLDAVFSSPPWQLCIF